MDSAPSSELVQPVAPQLPALPPATRPPQPPALVYLARLAPGSRRTMAQSLNAIAAIVDDIAGIIEPRHDLETLPWWFLTYPYTQALRSRLAEKYQAATARKMLAALRGCLRECWRLGLMDGEIYRKAVDLEPIRGKALLRGRQLSPGELAALFRSCAEDGVLGSRDAALLAILYGAALRRAEAAALDVSDYVPDPGEASETRGLIVRAGKGNQARAVPLPAGARAAIDAWLERRGREPGPLLVAMGKGGRVRRNRLTPERIWEICRARAAKASVSAFSPHDMRRTHVSDLLDAGADLATAQKLAGHASPVTTARYDRRDERAKRRAVDLLHVPFDAA